MQELAVAGCGLHTAEHFKSLSAALDKLPDLNTLYLGSTCAHSFHGLEALVPALGALRNLRILDLSGYHSAPAAGDVATGEDGTRRVARMTSDTARSVVAALQRHAVIRRVVLTWQPRLSIELFNMNDAPPWLVL